MSVPVGYKDGSYNGSGYSPHMKLVVGTFADSPPFIMLVSNNFAEFGSSGSLPLVTVCGTLSLFDPLYCHLSLL